jgi:hypothetical protein
LDYYSQDNNTEAERLTASSLILLTIFVFAVGLIIYLSLTMPWANSDAGPAIEDIAAEQNLIDPGQVSNDHAPFDGDEVALQAD